MHITVFVTTKNKEEAEKIAENLVQFKLAACVNIIDGIQSVYTWEEKLCKEAECLMMIKTKKILFDDLEKAIKTHHSYDNPEIFGVPIDKASKAYLDWIDDSTA